MLFSFITDTFKYEHSTQNEDSQPIKIVEHIYYYILVEQLL